MEGKTITVFVSEVVTRGMSLIIGGNITEEEAVKLLAIKQDCVKGTEEYDLINKYLGEPSNPEDSQLFENIEITLEN